MYGTISDADIKVECVVERESAGGLPQVVGCGVSGLEEGESWTGETPQERADVWFKKTSS